MVLNPINRTLSYKLRHQTQQEHKEAEVTSFMGKLLKGVVTHQEYFDYLNSLYHIYTEIEACFQQNKEDQYIKLVYFPELFRRDSLKADIDFFQSAYSCKVQFLPKARLFVEHLQTLQANPKDCFKIIAHAYTRYMGDLSGGQILKSKVAQKFSFNERNGMQFYEFPQVTDILVLKQKWREQVDQIPVELHSAIIDESITSFRLNIELLNSI